MKMLHFNFMRKSAGNICLVLFIAFLFSILVTPVIGGGNAYAANPGTMVTPVVKDANGQWVSGTEATIVGDANGYKLLVNLAINPSTPEVFNDITVAFTNRIITVYADSSSVDSVYYNTYSKVYSMSYQAPADFKHSAYDTVYGKVYIGTQSFYDIILNLDPYIDRGGNGGSSSTPAPTVPAPVQVVEPALQFVGEAAKDVVIKAGNVSFSVPAGALSSALADLLTADPNTKVTFKVTEVTPAAAGLADKMGTSDFANLKAVGKIFSFEIIANSGGKEVKVNQFTKKIKVTIPYTASDLGGLKEDTLGAYWISNSGLVYVGGIVDKTKKEVSFETEHFSNYTLAAKTIAFADIVTHWAKADIQQMADKGIVKGLTDNKYGPDTTITRAQFAALLVRALGLAETKPGTATFADVDASDWYYSAVETAAAQGLVKGSSGKFSPEGKITRQEMAVMVTRALKVGGKAVTLTASDVEQQLTKFSDNKQIADWANEGVAVASKEGIVTGRTASTFVAAANATRAEGAVMIKRVLNSVGKL